MNKAMKRMEGSEEGEAEAKERISNIDLLVLSAISALAALLTFQPHFRYPFLLHVDEWFHVAVAKEIILGVQTDWYSGEPFKLGMERAWHLLLASIYFLFRPSATQWIYLPALFHVLAVFSTFIFTYNLFGKKEAHISALLVALIPSNVTIGGPVFLMPVNLSLIFIPLALLFAFKEDKDKRKETRNCIILFAITTFLLYAHPPTAVILLSILFFYFLLNLFSKEKSARRKAVLIFAVMALSVLISIPNYMETLQEKGAEAAKFNFWIQMRAIPYLYGFIPSIFFIVGLYFLSRRRRKEEWCLLLSSLFLALDIFLFTMFGLNWLIPYNRIYIPLFLLMSIIAGYGFGKLVEIEKPFRSFGCVLLLIFLAITVIFSVQQHLGTRYYHLINNEDYNNFLWIKENTPEDAIVLLEPWKARAFAPIAERRVYTVRPFGPDPEIEAKNELACLFFVENCSNTSFLIENNISVVYSPVECQNKILVKVWNNTYFVHSPVTAFTVATGDERKEGEGETEREQS